MVWVAIATISISVFVAIIGASVGSFLNVVVYRIPAGKSLLYPPSRCPKCGHGLGARDNVPVLGWLWLRGRCRYCRTPIAARYPLVEAATAVVFLLVFWRFGWGWQTVGYWTLLSWLLALSLIDLDTMTLPATLTKPLLVSGIVFRAITGWLATQQLAGAAGQVFDGILGMALMLWLLEAIYWLALAIVGRPSQGEGDAHLMAAIGVWLGWKLVLLGWFLGNILGALVGIPAKALGRLKPMQAIPFGPFLALGSALSLFYGEAIVSAYLQLLGIAP